MNLSTSEFFTPIFDTVALRFGILSAAVYGLVWRYCQMSNGVCKASIASLATRLGLSRLTVLRRLELLVAAGLLIDRTPGLRNRPHIYAINKSAAEQGERNGAAAHLAGVSESDTAPAGGVAQRPGGVSESDSTVSGINSTVSGIDTRYTNNRSPAVSQRDLNQTLLRDFSEEDKLGKEAIGDWAIGETRVERREWGQGAGTGPTAASLWNFISGELARQMSRADYSTWVQPACPLAWDGVTLTVGVANPYGRDWLNARVQVIARRTLQGRLNQPGARLAFIVE